MPTLTDPNQVFALQLSAASAITWTLQQQQTVATPQNVGSSTNPQNLDFEGVASALGVTSIGAPGIPGFTLEATYISIINTGAEAQVVTYGKVILPFTVLRRLDCMLEANKLAELEKREKAKLTPEPSRWDWSFHTSALPNQLTAA